MQKFIGRIFLRTAFVLSLCVQTCNLLQLLPLHGFYDICEPQLMERTWLAILWTEQPHHQSEQKESWMACMSTEGTSLSKGAGEIVTFQNLKASVCCLDPPQDQRRDKIIPQSAHIRSRRLLKEIKRLPQNLLFSQAFFKVKLLCETFVYRENKARKYQPGILSVWNMVSGISNTSNFCFRNHFWMLFFSVYRGLL